MKPEYIKYMKEENGMKGDCERLSKKMQKQFSELIICKGWYYDLFFQREIEHWWLKTDEGEIVDPTKSQFYIQGINKNYREYKKGDKVNIGRCHNCGEDIQGLPGQNKSFCNAFCQKETISYLNSI